MRADKILFYITMAVIYSLIVGIALYTPMHSDDFPYSTIGLSPESHINHYLTWSGRILADYISTIILSTGSHTVISLINSFGSMLLIYNIAKLPVSISKKTNYSKLSLSAIVLFLLYWVSNPNIGQVMFWVVGSANYMWTTLFIVFSIRKTIEFRENQYDKYQHIIFIFLISTLAGITNENTCITLVFCMLALALYYKITSYHIGKIIYASLVGSVIGASVMLLAPGNFARAGGDSLSAWRSMSLASKIKRHLFSTMPDVMSHIWVAVVVFMFFCIIMSICGKSENKKAPLLSLLMFLSFLSANAVMVMSPAYPPRAMNGQFIFLLCSISVMMYSISKLFYIIIAPVAASLLLLFIPRYYSMHIAYKQTYKQSFIRTEIINKAKENGEKNVEIPSFYFLGLLKDGDKFDTYHSPYMASYYSMGKITSKDAPFNYAVISNDYDYILNVDVNNNTAKGIYSYNDKFRNESVFIVEFNDKADTPYSDDFMLFIKPIVSGRVVNDGTSLPMRTIDIDGRHFTYVRIKNIDYNSIDGIEFGGYKRSSGDILFNYKK
ncbi:DUF6056 family protein [Morganella morganii]|uniref:DUF6056 family protein n=1 Tax=Morganella morganii TaxID=582 RepID=UPI0028D1285F|nr:DUF6056 family protein [Morganella morganii]WNP29340.1 DUF6056 family protein [Morganella morganii]